MNLLPLKKVDINDPRWFKSIVSREEILDNLVTEPNPALYEQCEYSDNWRLRETPK